MRVGRAAWIRTKTFFISRKNFKIQNCCTYLTPMYLSFSATITPQPKHSPRELNPYLNIRSIAFCPLYQRSIWHDNAFAMLSSVDIFPKSCKTLFKCIQHFFIQATSYSIYLMLVSDQQNWGSWIRTSVYMKFNSGGGTRTRMLFSARIKILYGYPISSRRIIKFFPILHQNKN